MGADFARQVVLMVVVMLVDPVGADSFCAKQAFIFLVLCDMLGNAGTADMPVEANDPVTLPQYDMKVMGYHQDAAAPAVATTEGDGIVNVDPETGELTIGVQNDAQESITITVPVTCQEGESPSKVMLMLGDNSFTMTSAGENNYTVTLNIPADLPNAEGPFDIEVTYDCNGQANMTEIGQLTLYDPSGTITDRTTGEAIAGATVNLYYLTDSTPDTAGQNGDCRTVNSRPDDKEGIYGAWSGLEAAELETGVWVNPALLTINSTQAISPTINPQTTGNNGRYGWDVAEGCWYVVVQADGYESIISPLVGVPPEVTDLDIALAPQSLSMELYFPIISRD
jgi:hypothetical protein